MAAQIERHQEIDFLRGFAIAAMILIHTTVYFLEVPLSYLIWDYSQFAVQVFVFCSAYVFFLKKPVISKNHFFSYFKKRLLRFLIPYYIFLCVLFSVIYLFEPKKLTFQYVLDSIFLVGGVDINWLILLFIMFIFLFPFYYYLKEKHSGVWKIFICISFLSSILFLFYGLPMDYKYIMWLPWSVMTIFAVYFRQYENKMKFIIISFISSLVVFSLSFFYLTSVHHATQLYNNKYPPNTLLLSYGTLCTTLLYVIFKQKFMKFSFLKNTLNFFSFYSYEIFFIHYIIIYLVAKTLPYKKLTWIGFILIVFGATVTVQYLINVIRKMYKAKLQKG